MRLKRNASMQFNEIICPYQNRLGLMGAHCESPERLKQELDSVNCANDGASVLEVQFNLTKYRLSELSGSIVLEQSDLVPIEPTCEMGAPMAITGFEGLLAMCPQKKSSGPFAGVAEPRPPRRLEHLT